MPNRSCPWFGMQHGVQLWRTTLHASSNQSHNPIHIQEALSKRGCLPHMPYLHHLKCTYLHIHAVRVWLLAKIGTADPTQDFNQYLLPLCMHAKIQISLSMFLFRVLPQSLIPLKHKTHITYTWTCTHRNTWGCAHMRTHTCTWACAPACRPHLPRDKQFGRGRTLGSRRRGGRSC